MSTPTIKVEDLSMRYGVREPWAVSDVSLFLEEGEILTLLGPSGCGKTTVLRLIAGFEVPERGRVTIDGHLVAGAGAWYPPEQRGVGMVFQNYALFPHLTVAENVGFGLHLWPLPLRSARIGEVLRLVDLLALRDRYPHELSGGQQQRIALARALAPGPLVILLDEPFSNLDADMRVQVRQEVRDILRRSKMTALFVTHEQQEAFEISDRMAVMNKGRIEQLDTPENIFHSPGTPFVARFLGQTDLVPGVVRGDRVETELGSFPYFTDGGGLPDGMRVEAVIRPADVDVIPSLQGTATVRGRRFRGSDNLYTLILASGTRVHSAAPWDFVLPLGSKVSVSMEPLRVVVFPVGEGGGVRNKVLARRDGAPS